MVLDSNSSMFVFADFANMVEALGMCTVMYTAMMAEYIESNCLVRLAAVVELEMFISPGSVSY